MTPQNSDWAKEIVTGLFNSIKNPTFWMAASVNLAALIFLIPTNNPITTVFACIAFSIGIILMVIVIIHEVIGQHYDKLLKSKDRMCNETIKQLKTVSSYTQEMRKGDLDVLSKMMDGTAVGVDNSKDEDPSKRKVTEGWVAKSD